MQFRIHNLGDGRFDIIDNAAAENRITIHGSVSEVRDELKKVVVQFDSLIKIENKEKMDAWHRAPGRFWLNSECSGEPKFLKQLSSPVTLAPDGSATVQFIYVDCGAKMLDIKEEIEYDYTGENVGSKWYVTIPAAMNWLNTNVRVQVYHPKV